MSSSVFGMTARLQETLYQEAIENPSSRIWLGEPSVSDPSMSILDPTIEYNTNLNTYPNEASLEIDPFKPVAKDIEQINANIIEILGTDHPILSKVANYFFQNDAGKKVRPSMILLLAKATEIHRKTHHPIEETGGLGLDDDITRRAQLRLAEITEMIHTATLLHDDVIDEADTRRNKPSANKLFGSKMSILAGDFLLARSSICLARLRNFQAVELMSTAIEHLVKGEVMQMKDNMSDLEFYLRKNFYKTGSLMANGSQAALAVANHTMDLQQIGFAYGKHVGLAFQLIDDVLDFQPNTGKPMLADLKAGLATAPVLLALNDYPELYPLIQRRFSKPKDVDRVLEILHSSGTIEKTIQLAQRQAELACTAIAQLEKSPERDALAALTHQVLSRTR